MLVHRSDPSSTAPISRGIGGRLLRCGCAALWFGLFLSVPSQSDAQELAGAWLIDSYQGGGNVGPTTGQMLFAAGQWTLIYTMDETDGATAGRAHGGSYEVSGDTLVFVLDWSLQVVGGQPSVSSQPTENPTQFTLAGDQLTLRYRSGGVIQFTRIEPRD